MNPGFQWARILSTPWVTGLATLGPIGYWGRAPGTLGSVAGLVLYMLIFYGLSLLFFALLLAFLIYFAVGICGEAEVRLSKRDPSEVILDEFVAMPLVFWGMDIYMGQSWSWLIMLFGFGLFRIFDILKPLGIARLQSLKGGWGVVMDDIAAAVAACAVLHMGLWVWSCWFAT
ncbi:MAG TPA: phosphatidylglycerophosphatase A [Opitutae bacterium]|nr:phosphatidylglycerophosphatase A [Opitutae bacterium]|tara:strand:+ start:276 stop:794 length:519 start_codon:yes stop_codon:yes gene_type:complete